MGFAASIRRFFGRKSPRALRTSLDRQERAGAVGVEVISASQTRRFQAAVPTRLNRETLAQSHGESINTDIATDLPVLMARCAFEFASNPLFEGVVNTFKDDVVGPEGPTLQVSSDSNAFNDAVEAAFKAVMADPDPSHRYGGVESMKTWVHGLLLAGSYVNVYTNVERPGKRISLGFRTIHARRLVTPAQHAGDPSVAFGVRLDPTTGAAVEFYIDKPHQLGAFTLTYGEFETIPAVAVQHCFIPVEPEQLTGYPMLTSVLETAADIREYDKYVMEAAKNAAGHAVGLQAAHPEMITDPEPITDDCIRMEPGQANVAPMGWQWASLAPTQPGAQYVEFRRERGAELGRPIHMPLLVVFLTAAEANFSSAQYEGTVYCDGVLNVQKFIERRSMNPIVERVIAELTLRGSVQPPAKYELTWTWNVPAHANIEKFVSAIEKMVQLGIIAASDASAMVGKNWEKVVASRKRCKADLEAAGLPPTPMGNGAESKAEGDESPPPKKLVPKKNRNARRFAINR
jgi:capsid protein